MHWPLVLTVLDGSSDGSAKELESLFSHPGLTILERKKNGGKGVAVLDGLRRAHEQGYTRVLVMDADGQHPPDKIKEFFDLAEKNPHAFILGVPIFTQDAPKLRVYGRLGGNTFAEIETLWGGIRDSLFGFRVYPVKETLKIMERIRTGRGFDFDTEIAVRLYWEGLKPINVPVPVAYPPKRQAGFLIFDTSVIIGCSCGVISPCWFRWCRECLNSFYGDLSGDEGRGCRGRDRDGCGRIAGPVP